MLYVKDDKVPAGSFGGGDHKLLYYVLFHIHNVGFDIFSDPN